MWRNPLSGNAIPATTRRIVRLQQDNRCATVDPATCTHTIDVYDHVANAATLPVHRSHANDPALVEGLCTACQATKAQQGIHDSRIRRRFRKPEEKN